MIAVSLCIFWRFFLAFFFKTLYSRSNWKLAVFDPKSCDMTSLKRHFLKNFTTDFAEFWVNVPNWCVRYHNFASTSALNRCLHFKLLKTFSRRGVVRPPPPPFPTSQWQDNYVMNNMTILKEIHVFSRKIGRWSAYCLLHIDAARFTDISFCVVSRASIRSSSNSSGMGTWSRRRACWLEPRRSLRWPSTPSATKRVQARTRPSLSPARTSTSGQA